MAATPPRSENERLRRLKNEKNAQDREITIWEPKEPNRRADCLADPLLYMKTYFGDRFTRPFSDDQKEAINTIIQCAALGQDEIIAAPRGDWKTETCKALIHFMMSKAIIFFPVIIGATAKDAFKKYDDIKWMFESPIYADDFPEVAAPIIALERTPTKAKKMTFRGEYLDFVWSADYCTFPKIAEVPWTGEPSHFGRCAMEYRGLDAAIRGINVRGLRPDLPFCDDLETEESAKSDTQIKDREDRLDKAAGGLAGGGETLGRIVLGTIQNEKCLTNKKIKEWGGKRYKAIKLWPGGVEDVADADMRLCEEYVDLYKEERATGSKTMDKAQAFYLKHRDTIEDGVVESNPHYKSTRKREDGTALEVSCFQHVLNEWAKKGFKYVLTEIQNDPPKETAIEKLNLSADMVRKAISGFPQRVEHREADAVTIGIDLGQYECHWTAGNWLGGMTGFIHDYGIVEVANVGSEKKQIHRAIYAALCKFREQVVLDLNPAVVNIDSGAFTNVVYEFVREYGAPFYAVKGTDAGRFQHGVPSKTRLVGDNYFSSLLKDWGIWLCNLNSDYWKSMTHQLFVTPTFDEAQQYNKGSLSLFAPPKRDDGSYNVRRHLAFSKHITAEELRTEFIEGKGLKTAWFQVNRNNHWLDSTYMMVAAARMAGISLELAPTKPVEATEKPRPTTTGPRGSAYLATQRN